jgi:hypothetical protein
MSKTFSEIFAKFNPLSPNDSDKECCVETTKDAYAVGRKTERKAVLELLRKEKEEWGMGSTAAHIIDDLVKKIESM